MLVPLANPTSSLRSSRFSYPVRTPSISDPALVCAAASSVCRAALLYLFSKKFLAFFTILPRESLLYVLLASVGDLEIDPTPVPNLPLVATLPKPLGKSKGALAEDLWSLHFPTEPAMAASNMFPEIWEKFASLIALLNTDPLNPLPTFVARVVRDNSCVTSTSLASNSSATVCDKTPEIIFTGMLVLLGSFESALCKFFAAFSPIPFCFVVSGIGWPLFPFGPSKKAPKSPRLAPTAVGFSFKLKVFAPIKGTASSACKKAPPTSKNPLPSLSAPRNSMSSISRMPVFFLLRLIFLGFLGATAVFGAPDLATPFPRVPDMYFLGITYSPPSSSAITPPWA